MGLVGFEELHEFCGVEEGHEVVDEFEIVAVVLVEELFELIDKMFTRFALPESFHVHQHTDGFLDLKRKDAGVDWRFFLVFLHGRSIAICVVVVVLPLLFVLSTDLFLVVTLKLSIFVFFALFFFSFELLIFPVIFLPFEVLIFSVIFFPFKLFISVHFLFLFEMILIAF